MPFLFVYSPSDFVSGLPDEYNAAASGSGPWSLVLKADAEPTVIEISDEDAIFDEVDGTQEIASTVNIDGTEYAAGTTVNSAYDLINSGSGHKITSLHFGSDGYNQGAVQGVVSTVKMEAGQTYTFDQERTSHQQANAYDQYVACFQRGTSIATVWGEVPVEDLAVGDLVTTPEGCFQPLKIKLERKIGAAELARAPKLRPIRILAGSLGGGLPKQDLLVSRQHRMLIQSKIARRMFGEAEVLVPAAKLTAFPGIDVADDVTEVAYFHLVFDRHEIIYAEGAPTESLYLGPRAMKSFDDETRREILSVFPEVGAVPARPDPARLIPRGKSQKTLVERHLKNDKPCIEAMPAV